MQVGEREMGLEEADEEVIETEAAKHKQVPSRYSSEWAVSGRSFTGWGGLLAAGGRLV